MASRSIDDLSSSVRARAVAFLRECAARGLPVGKRLKEPSTWAGLAALLETLKLVVPHYAGLIVGLQAIAGGVAVVMRESGGAGAGGGVP